MQARDILVNPETNKIYVGFLAAIHGKSTVAVIDGATNQVTKVTLPASLYGQAVNTVTNFSRRKNGIIDALAGFSLLVDFKLGDVFGQPRLGCQPDCQGWRHP